MGSGQSTRGGVSEVEFSHFIQLPANPEQQMVDPLVIHLPLYGCGHLCPWPSQDLKNIPADTTIIAKVVRDDGICGLCVATDILLVNDGFEGQEAVILPLLVDGERLPVNLRQQYQEFLDRLRRRGITLEEAIIGDSTQECQPTETTEAREWMQTFVTLQRSKSPSPNVIPNPRFSDFEEENLQPLDLFTSGKPTQQDDLSTLTAEECGYPADFESMFENQIVDPAPTEYVNPQDLYMNPSVNSCLPLDQFLTYKSSLDTEYLEVGKNDQELFPLLDPGPQNGAAGMTPKKKKQKTRGQATKVNSAPSATSTEKSLVSKKDKTTPATPFSTLTTWKQAGAVRAKKRLTEAKQSEHSQTPNQEKRDNIPEYAEVLDSGLRNSSGTIARPGHAENSYISSSRDHKRVRFSTPVVSQQADLAVNTPMSLHPVPTLMDQLEMSPNIAGELSGAVSPNSTQVSMHVRRSDRNRKPPTKYGFVD
jgi:hypothetical protein